MLFNINIDVYSYIWVYTFSFVRVFSWVFVINYFCFFGLVLSMIFMFVRGCLVRGFGEGIRSFSCGSFLKGLEEFFVLNGLV